MIDKKQINRVHNQCCLETMAMMPSDSVDLTLTSPPYDAMRDYSGTGFSQFEAIAKELYRITKLGGVVVWIIGDQTIKGNESGTSFRNALYFRDEVGFNLFDTMIYQKPPRGAVGNNKTYWQSFEYMFVLSKGSPKTINLIKDRKNKKPRARLEKNNKRQANGKLVDVGYVGHDKISRRTNVWGYFTGKGHSTKDKIAFEHPAIFPEKLAADHIISWSNEGDIVYDPFMGSGTTAKMAIKLKRDWIGSEISKDYCRIIKERLYGAGNGLFDGISHD